MGQQDGWHLSDNVICICITQSYKLDTLATHVHGANQKQASENCYTTACSLWTGSVWGKGEKMVRKEEERVRACRQTFGTAIPPSYLVIADHLSARSLSVTWIHWNVINFACKKGVGRQHTTFTSCQNAAFSYEFFSPFPLLAIFSPFPQTENLFTG